MVEKIKVLDFDDDLEDILPWEQAEDDFDFEEELVLLEEDDLQDAFLSFLDPLDDVPTEFIQGQVSKALEEYTMEELLTENEMEEAEAVGILYELGYIGLPEFIENEDEEIQDREETED